MITKLRLKNFKSFDDVEINFLGIGKKTKKLAIIYGENGSGKSNIISAISFLKKSISSLSFQDQINHFIENNKIKEKNAEDLLRLIENSPYNITNEIMKDKMIGSNGNMVIEIEFLANNKPAIYRIECDKNSFVYESLHYPLEKRMVLLFEINNSEFIYFNKQLILDKRFEEEVKYKISRYYGKHTFMSIILKEIGLNNFEFIKKIISNQFLNVLYEMLNCSVICQYSESEEGHIHTDSDLLRDLKNGELDNSKESLHLIKQTEKSLNYYFTSLYSDIKNVHYKIRVSNKKINYFLFFNKMINGSIKEIPYNYESTGTLKLLNIFPLIYDCVAGKTVFIDEIDSGIHDLLMLDIIENLSDQIKGQLIITTHNTLLLEKIDPEYAYIITSNLFGNKKVNCIKDFGRIQTNHNVAQRYLKGVYGGIPMPGYIDFENILHHNENDINE